jgi:hypothetical protein
LLALATIAASRRPFLTTGDNTAELGVKVKLPETEVPSRRFVWEIFETLRVSALIISGIKLIDDVEDVALAVATTAVKAPTALPTGTSIEEVEEFTGTLSS